MRIIIAIDRMRLTRMVCRIDWIDLFTFALVAKAEVIRRRAQHLIALFLHSPAVFGLKTQLIGLSPMIVIGFFRDGPRSMQEFILMVIGAFRPGVCPLDYCPFPEQLFRDYLEMAARDAQGRIPKLVHRLLVIYNHPGCLLVRSRGELDAYVNAFVRNYAITLIAQVDRAKAKCLKALFKLRFTDDTVLRSFELWRAILGVIRNKSEGIDRIPSAVKVQLWKALTNAMLFQPEFSPFLLAQPDLRAAINAMLSVEMCDKMGTWFLLDFVLGLIQYSNRPALVFDAVRTENLEVFFDHLMKEAMKKQLTGFAKTLVECYNSQFSFGGIARMIINALVLPQKSAVLRNLVNSQSMAPELAKILREHLKRRLT